MCNKKTKGGYKVGAIEGYSKGETFDLKTEETHLKMRKGPGVGVVEVKGIRKRG